jgi:hypothetical protein
MTPSDEALRLQVIRMTRARRGSLCPSEVARAFGPGWRALMPRVRAVAAELAAEGVVVVTQRGSPVDARAARGPIRLAAPRDAGE